MFSLKINQQINTAKKGVIIPIINHPRFRRSGRLDRRNGVETGLVSERVEFVDQTKKRIRISKISLGLAGLPSLGAYSSPTDTGLQSDSLAELGKALNRILRANQSVLIGASVTVKDESWSADKGGPFVPHSLTVVVGGRKLTEIRVDDESVEIRHGKNRYACGLDCTEIQRALMRVLTDYATRKNVAIRFDAHTTPATKPPGKDVILFEEPAD